MSYPNPDSDVNPNPDPASIDSTEEDFVPVDDFSFGEVTNEKEGSDSPIPSKSLMLHWIKERADAARLVRKGRDRIMSTTTSLANGPESVVFGLAPLMFYARTTIGASRPQTVVGMTVTLQADLDDRTVIDTDGDVADDSLLYAFMRFLEDTHAQGLSQPVEEFRKFLEEPAMADAFDAIRALLAPTYDSPASAANAHHSVTATPVPAGRPSGRDTASILAALDNHIGLGSVKEAAHQFVALTQLDQARGAQGLPTVGQSRHMVFLGNPGTGKTMLARTFADLLASLDGTADAPFVEADRSMLIGEWLGSSAIKTRHVAEAAYGGVLFIDEAYSLIGATEVGHDRFAQEAIDTLVKIMEDERERLTVILAGYPDPMKRLLQANPGLASRIGLTVHFPDYDESTLLDIFVSMATDQGYRLLGDATLPIRQALQHLSANSNSGNARAARKLFEASVRALALRLNEQHGNIMEIAGSELTTIRLADTIQATRLLGHELTQE